MRQKVNVYVLLVIAWVVAMAYFILFHTGSSTSDPLRQRLDQYLPGSGKPHVHNGDENIVHNSQVDSNNILVHGNQDPVKIASAIAEKLPGSGKNLVHNGDGNIVHNSQVDSNDVLVHDNQDLVKVASAIAEKHGLVLFTLMNDAYYDLGSSWLCNTERMASLHSKILVLTTDVDTGRRLKRRWPALTVVSMNVSAFTGALEYSRAGYVRLMVERTRCINRLVQAKVRMLLFEVDFVWLSDPLPEVLSHKDADVVGVGVYGRNHQLICGCFLLLNPTPATEKVWSRLTEQMEDLYKKVANRDRKTAVSEATNDQTFLSSLLNAKYGGVKVVYLPDDLFPEGKWYMDPKLKAANPNPLVIHNNWVIGNDVKIKRAKKFGHWFVSNDSTTSDVICNVTAVNNVLAKGPRPST